MVFLKLKKNLFEWGAMLQNFPHVCGFKIELFFQTRGISLMSHLSWMKM